MVREELGIMAGRLSLNYGKYMAVASAVSLTAKNLEFKSEELDKNLPEELDKNLREELDKNLPEE